ncbi:MAG TPA: RNA 2',3'-cyclic phosphodiesterase [Bacillota bacterium]|nr:RNA 2',3'-cyclic phosphodiesterase [Bacillota bacterium]HPT86658.1 RNA 2',3'-cyclic phosphodiesterase [Bacillota bacterium]
MRLFIGVWPSREMVSEIQEYIRSASSGSTGLRWVSPENLHFTLRFLGEVADERVAGLKEDLKRAAMSCRPFLLTLGKTGFFPNAYSPRVVWLGVKQGAKELTHLATMVQSVGMDWGLEPSGQRFQPHLTIARVVRGVRPVFAPGEKTHFNSETSVASFSLIESRLQPGGSVYRTIADFDFPDG